MNESVKIEVYNENIEFFVYSYYGNWNEIGGVYIFCKHVKFQNAYNPLYVGLASNFKQRFTGHEKWTYAICLGADKVLACVEQNKPKRVLIEDFLIKKFEPPLNISKVPTRHYHL